MKEEADGAENILGDVCEQSMMQSLPMSEVEVRYSVSCRIQKIDRNTKCPGDSL